MGMSVIIRTDLSASVRNMCETNFKCTFIACQAGKLQFTMIPLITFDYFVYLYHMGYISVINCVGLLYLLSHLPQG